MSTRNLLDPEIRPIIEALPQISLDREALPGLRHMISEQALLEPLDGTGVIRVTIEIPAQNEDHPPVRCLKYSPEKPADKVGAYLHIHGGGYVLGSPEMADARNLALASALEITILSVDYRLAPEHPAPAGLSDCYSALSWLFQNAERLGIDPQKIAIGGESAGGGLAAATALHAADLGEHAVCFQVLTYPMLDERTGSAEHPGDPLTGEFVWTREHNQTAWRHYLGPTPPSAPLVPARADNLSKLPPTWIGTAAMDLFRDENILFAQRLLNAGIATELIVYPGTCHGFQQARDAPVTKQYFRDQLEALKRAIG